MEEWEGGGHDRGGLILSLSSTSIFGFFKPLVGLAMVTAGSGLVVSARFVLRCPESLW